jgi:hypothetical protein
MVALELARVAALPAEELPGTVPRWLLARTAADILERNFGDHRIVEAYRLKSKSQSDKKFLLSNLALLSPVPPQRWIARKTHLGGYGYLGPALRGLAEFLGQEPVLPSKVLLNRSALKSILLKPAQDLTERDRCILQAALLR